MSKEAEFLFYRDVLIRTTIKLEAINAAAFHLASIQVKLPTSVRDAIPNMIYSDSRSDDDEMSEHMIKWFDDHPDGMPLFDEQGYTMALISGEGYPDVSCRNIGYHVKSALKDSAGYTWDHETGHNISFRGFLPSEIDAIVAWIKKKAEDAVEKRRDIHTRMAHYAVKWDRRLIIKQISTEPVPDHLTDDRTKWAGAPIYSLWWLTQVLGDEHSAGGVMERVWTIINSSAPEEGEPPVITTFSSHSSNRVLIGLDKIEIDAKYTVR